jgi:hypothetical protein
LTQALNDAVAAIAEAASGGGPNAQAHYASASARIALHGPPEVVDAWRRFQDEGNTVTDEEAGPIKADFDRAASKVEANLGKAGIPVPAHAEASSLTDLAAQEPEMVIAEAFRLVEQELRDALEAIGERLPDEARADQLTQLAADRGLITPLTVNAIDGVTVMHNLAVHGPHRDITTKQVDEYIVLIQGVIYAIQQNIRRYQAEHLADRT